MEQMGSLSTIHGLEISVQLLGQTPGQTREAHAEPALGTAVFPNPQCCITPTETLLHVLSQASSATQRH